MELAQNITKSIGFAAILVLSALLVEVSNPILTAGSTASQENRASISRTNSANSSELIPAAVLQNQPLLLIDPEDAKRNQGKLVVNYCIHSDSTATYYTYIYEWTFSDAPMWGELLGYPDHNWDYEPVIAVVDRSNGSLTYVYDSGHYRADTTSSKHLTVNKGSHSFAPLNRSLGETFGEETFCKLMPSRLSAMNEQLAQLPRLPFGSKLSLEWACNFPAQVASKGEFSTDEVGGKLPAQVNLVGGGLIGSFLSILFWMFTSLIGLQKRIPTVTLVGIGTLSGLATGITGGSVSDVALNHFHSVAASVSSGLLAGTLAGLVVCVILCNNFTRTRLISAVGMVGVSNILVALIVSLW